MTPAKPRCLDGEKVPGAHESLVKFLLPVGCLRLTEKTFLSRFHRPKPSEQLVHEQTLRYVSIPRLFDVPLDQSALLLGGKCKTEDGLREVVSRVYYVQLSLAQAMVIIAGL